MNTAGVKLARRVVEASFKDVMIAGDIGPLGLPLAPFGHIQPEDAFEIYQEQARALIEAGVDLILIETMVDLYAVREAVRAVHSVDETMPVIGSMTFTRDRRTLLGDTPQEVAEQMASFGVDVIGVNCSGGPAQLLRILKQMKAAVPGGRFCVMPNAGFPERVGGRIMYPAGPDYFKDYALAFWQAGANVIGGCCGTTPAHVNVISEAISGAPEDFAVVQLAELEGVRSTEMEPAEGPSGLAQKLTKGEFVIAVEMDPPRGFPPIS